MIAFLECQEAQDDSRDSSKTLPAYRRNDNHLLYNGPCIEAAAFHDNSNSKPFTCSSSILLLFLVVVHFVSMIVLAHCVRDSNAQIRREGGIATAAILPATKSGGKTMPPEKRPRFFSPASSRFFCRSTSFPRCSGSTRLLLENGDHPLIVRFFFSGVATSEEKTEPAGPGNREPWTADAVAALTRESRFEQPFGRPRFHSAALGSAPRDTSRVARAAWIKVGVTSRRGGIRRQCGGTGGFSLSLINPFSFLLAPSLSLLSLNMYYCYSILAVVAILFKILFNGNLRALEESGKRVIIKASQII